MCLYVSITQLQSSVFLCVSHLLLPFYCAQALCDIAQNVFTVSPTDRLSFGVTVLSNKINQYHTQAVLPLPSCI